MEASLNQMAELLSAWAQEAMSYVWQPWFIYQALVIIVLFGISKLLSDRIEPRIEEHARRIKGQPGLLRVIVALIRRSEWIIFAILMFLALIVFRAITWPAGAG